jgi:endonuclease YncB( thermonuclease family)
VAAAGPARLWWYRCAPARVIDGDTFEMRLDRGLDSRYRREELTITVRLLGVNCPEVHGVSREAGLEASAFTADWLAAHALHRSTELSETLPLYGHTVKAEDASDNFGRYLIEVVCGVGHSLTTDLLTSGNGLPLLRAVWGRSQRVAHQAAA